MNEVRQTEFDEGPPRQLSVPALLLTQAQELGIDAGQAAADGIRRAVMNARAKQYREENRETAEAWNNYIASHGFPFNDVMEHPT
jgi:post-segregation antitoxin (ccd killing protein)